ncbi:hypothetical protein HQQ81_20120 [Microbacteriaceae bacterium VKM Ac-2854]|nr:hypothetical protein [Microbacteriaceae bacterium VKM Ac-2854]
MPSTRMLRTAAVTAALLSLAGCTRSPGGPDVSTPPPVLSGATPEAGVHDAVPPSDPHADDAAIAIATGAMTAYCRPDLGREAWIRGLYPYISQSAAVGFQTVDPASVPCSAITGSVRVRDGDEAFTMRVWVTTDAGDYSVSVQRRAAAEGWLADDLVPPGRQ